jgi:hypothetical protein
MNCVCIREICPQGHDLRHVSDMQIVLCTGSSLTSVMQSITKCLLKFGKARYRSSPGYRNCMQTVLHVHQQRLDLYAWVF